MTVTNALTLLNNYANSLTSSLKSGAYYASDKKPQKIEFIEKVPLEEGKIKGILNLNDFELILYEYESADEIVELTDCSIIDNILVRKPTFKCLLFSFEEDAKNIEEIKTNDLSFRIKKLNEEIILENLDIFLVNIDTLLNINGIAKREDKYVTYINKLIDSKKIFVLELFNLDTIEQNTFKKLTFDSPSDFVRTNLLIINEKYGTKFFLFQRDIIEQKDINNPIKQFQINYYPFFNDLIFFFESAQKVPFNHIKYLEYYHVLEYFATSVAIKRNNNILKDLVQVYLEEKDYDKLSNLAENLYKSLPLPVKDEMVKEVLKRVDYNYIVDMINEHKLGKELIKEKWGANGLFPQGCIDNNFNMKKGVNKMTEEEFYNNLYNRIYKIRNNIVHSKLQFQNINKKFIPDKDNLKALEPDLTLIKILSYNLAKKECVDKTGFI